MAISTYLQLKTAVASWMHRTDLTTIIPDFITIAESNIRRDLRLRAMEATATGTLTTTTLAFPTRLCEVRRVLLDTYEQEYVPPAHWAVLDTRSGGHYTILGETFQFQSSTASYQIDYYAWFAALSADGDTNWLLTNHPDVYLFAAMVEAVGYTEGDPSKWMAKYAQAVQRVRSSDKNFGGPLRIAVRPETVV